MSEPEQIRIGTTLQWDRYEPLFTDGTWTGAYSLTASGLPDIAITTTESNGTFTVDVKPSATKFYVAGQYSWVFTVTDGTDTFVQDSGVIEVIPLAATDDNELLNAETYLSEAEAELRLRVSGKAESYSIKDRSLSRCSTAEVRNIISYWQDKVNRLQKAIGGGNRSITYAKFSR